MCLSCGRIEFIDVVIYVPLTPFACMLFATVPCSCWGFLSAQIGFDGVITFSLSMAHFLFELLVSVSMGWSMSEQRLCVQYFCLKSLKVFLLLLLLMFNIQRENWSLVSNWMTQFQNQILKQITNEKCWSDFVREKKNILWTEKNNIQLKFQVLMEWFSIS